MLIFKLATIVIILITAYVGAFLAAKVAASKRRDKIFSFGNALAGGIFLGTGMLHIMPDVHDELRLLLGPHGIPWVALFTCCGFLLILFLQRVLMYEGKVLEDAARNMEPRKFSPRTLITSLSMHALIAGIALGTEEIFRKAVVLFIAILAYKLSAVFTLEVNLDRLNLAKVPRYKREVSLLGFITPLGIITGMFLTAVLNTREAQLLAITFDSLMAGSFLYIAFADILDEEFTRPKDRLIKFCLVALGFFAMAAITLQI